MRRFVGIGHVFHHTVQDIEALELHHWLQLAIAYDEHVEETKRQSASRRGRRGR
ncbi:hypothetical protein JNB63_02150 [Microbacterium trichothecenolyticum]|uniref:hypothetical protein n=1 Tax=Microbacterium trichothecenolyticum TaxID=69370 RepID=UPI001C6EA52F|nr:hypothetical protein [Microbacterium trichothecenolyticum]MBW9118888.1 hypothetical protein [Microbacterium trichothecenolyticum]